MFAPDDSAWMSFLSSTAAPSALGGSSVVAVKDVAGALRWLAAGQAGANRDEREARLLRTWWAVSERGGGRRARLLGRLAAMLWEKGIPGV